MEAETETDGWFQRLNDGRVEVFLKKDGVKLRATADEEQIEAYVSLWEEQTGGTVAGLPWKRRVTKPMEGQLALDPESEGALDVGATTEP